MSAFVLNLFDPAGKHVKDTLNHIWTLLISLLWYSWIDADRKAAIWAKTRDSRDNTDSGDAIHEIAG